MSEWLAKYWPVLVTIINFILGWVVWSLGRGFASRDTVEAIERRVSAIEVDIRHLPTKDDIRAVQESIANLGTQLARIEERHDGVKELVKRVENAVTRHEAIFADAARR